MADKTQGSYTATYGYRFGDKLKSATSNFPVETASVGKLLGQSQPLENSGRDSPEFPWASGGRNSSKPRR